MGFTFNVAVWLVSVVDGALTLTANREPFMRYGDF
jgi:hypothetical protein